MRLIDADALFDGLLRKRDPELICPSMESFYEDIISDMIDLINDAPTIEKCDIPHYSKTTTDLISRADAIEEVQKMLQNCGGYAFEDYRRGLYEAQDILEALPSADAVSREDDCPVDDCTECKHYRMLAWCALAQPNRKVLTIEVVRCKDCIHLTTEYSDDGTCFYWCKHWDNATDEWVHCYYGERREP